MDIHDSQSQDSLPDTLKSRLAQEISDDLRVGLTLSILTLVPVFAFALSAKVGLAIALDALLGNLGLGRGDISTVATVLVSSTILVAVLTSFLRVFIQYEKGNASLVDDEADDMKHLRKG